MTKRWWCWPCLLTGAGAVLATFSALASDGDIATGPVGWRDSFLFAGGLVMALIGFFGTRLYARIDRLEATGTGTSTRLAEHYLKKDETRQLVTDVISPLHVKVDAIHTRLDQLNVPHAHAGHP